MKTIAVIATLSLGFQFSQGLLSIANAQQLSDFYSLAGGDNSPAEAVVRAGSDPTEALTSAPADTVFVGRDAHRTVGFASDGVNFYSLTAGDGSPAQVDIRIGSDPAEALTSASADTVFVGRDAHRTVGFASDGVNFYSLTAGDGSPAQVDIRIGSDPAEALTSASVETVFIGRDAHRTVGFASDGVNFYSLTVGDGSPAQVDIRIGSDPAEALTSAPAEVIAIGRNAFQTLGMATTISEQEVWDITRDWSDTENPNGPWSIYLNESLATGGLRGGDPWASPQPIWGLFTMGWSKSNGTEQFPHDWVEGDVFGHSDPNIDATSIRWSSPINGTISIEGGIWMARDIGRGNLWRISINGVSVTEGLIFSGDQFDRTNPMDFSLGTGGESVLKEVDVAVGDVVSLSLIAVDIFGDYAGVKFRVVGSVNPDQDGDGVPDDEDPFPDSDVSPTLIVGDVDLGIENVVFQDGSTMADLIAEIIDLSEDHGDLQSSISALTNGWKKAGLITGKEKGAIQSATAKLF